MVITLLHRVTDYVYHGHGLNAGTIGVEVQARAAGLLSNSRTFWRSRREKAAGKTFEQLVREPTPGILAAHARALRYYAALMAHRGHPLKAINLTHRQSARKPSDPGELLARNAATVAAELGFERDLTQRTWGRGTGQPERWVVGHLQRTIMRPGQKQ